VVVAFVGRLVDFKRVDRLLRAAALVDDPTLLRIQIVGDGPHGEELRTLARELGVEGLVEFLGYQDDVARVLGGADVLVQPSQGEPFGLAIIEGCGQGLLPVVFADGGGALEVIPPDGRVVRDEEELASALGALARSDSLGLEARRKRAAWARETFSIEKTARGYERLYEAALGETAPEAAVG
jgi:glycosyltransferase involved in cell wall biosynthesis